MFSHPGSLVLKSTLGAQFPFLPGGGRLHDTDILKNWAHYFIYSLLLLYSACSSVSCRPSSVVGWFFSRSSFCFSLPLPVLMVYKDLFLKFSILWSFTLCNIWSIAKKASYQASSCQFSAPLLLEDLRPCSRSSDSFWWGWSQTRAVGFWGAHQGSRSWHLVWNSAFC